jgi:hypothetical protein
MQIYHLTIHENGHSRRFVYEDRDQALKRLADAIAAGLDAKLDEVERAPALPKPTESDRRAGRNPERPVGARLDSLLKRRGWVRWRAAEAHGVRLPKRSAWLDGSADPTERERERITSVFGPGLP